MFKNLLLVAALSTVSMAQAAPSLSYTSNCMNIASSFSDAQVLRQATRSSTAAELLQYVPANDPAIRSGVKVIAETLFKFVNANEDPSVVYVSIYNDCINASK